jgi:hypothetical protein
MNYIPYCTGHYTTEYCRKKAKELRGSGEYQSVKLGAYLKEDGKSYCKIYIAIKEGER